MKIYGLDTPVAADEAVNKAYADTKLSNVLTTTGDIIYSSSGTTPAALPIGSAGEVLTVSAGVPSWQSAASMGSGRAKNLIIGGDFSTNPWQRGTSFAAIADTAYSADRYRYSQTGTMVATVTKTADAPTVAEAGLFTQHCWHYDVTTAQGSLGTNDLVMLQNRIEGYDFKSYAQVNFTLSFWVKATKTGVYSVSFRNAGLDRSYVSTYTVDASDTWEYKTITVTASPSAGTWDYTNGVGLFVAFVIASNSANSKVTSTLDTWQTGDFFSADTQVNGVDNTANNFKLALIQIEVGDAATPFEIRKEQEELSLCQRYYVRINTVREVGYPAAGGNFFMASLTNPVTMRTTPSFSVITAPTFNNASTFAAGTGTNTHIHVIQATASAGGQAFWNADGVYDLSAEL